MGRETVSAADGPDDGNNRGSRARLAASCDHCPAFQDQAQPCVFPEGELPAFLKPPGEGSPRASWREGASLGLWGLGHPWAGPAQGAPFLLHLGHTKGKVSPGLSVSTHGLKGQACAVGVPAHQAMAGPTPLPPSSLFFWQLPVLTPSRRPQQGDDCGHSEKCCHKNQRQSYFPGCGPEPSGGGICRDSRG